MRSPVMSPRRRRRGQRGQVVVLVALSAIALLGCTALAVDLTGQASAHRTVQNWTDAAAIAAIRDCDTTCNAKTEVQDALTSVQANSPWSGTAGWAASALPGSCSTTSCQMSSAFAGPAPYTNYTVTASSPPLTPRNASYNTDNYVEVDVAKTNSTNLAAVLGATSTLSTGHSIAWDTGPPTPYQYAFFAKILAESGNHSEAIAGDAYVGGGYTNQSNGKAALCVDEVPETTADNDAALDSGSANDSDVDDQGHVVFSTTPPTVGPDPSYGTRFTTTQCQQTGAGSLNVQSTAPGPSTAAQLNCPANSTAQSYQSGGSPVWVCVSPNPTLPAVAAPTPTASLCGNNTTGTVDAQTIPLNGGIYSVGKAGVPCAATIDFTHGDINCVSLVLTAGSTVSIINKKNSDYMTGYGYASDSTTNAAFLADNLSVPTIDPCPGHGNPADNSVIWAPDTSVLPMPTAVQNSSTGCCSNTLFVGTIFVPDQMIVFGTNQSLEDVGSLYCGEWQVQSGNHPNPIVTYDAGAAAPVASTIRLVE
jgi:Flp pilus assembly protein TadG